ncbi:MAG: hypothetical protein H7231_12895 [Rhodoferax sp.]|nr:hypothetical protein [Actinomycetota bacterium]
MSAWRPPTVLIVVTTVVIAAVLAVTVGFLRTPHDPSVPDGATARLVDPASFGLNTVHSAATVPYGAVRLWDTRTTWAHLEPVRGVFEWARLDGYVARARAQRVPVLLVLGSTPAWAATQPTAPGAGWLARGSSSPPYSDADWVAYVDAVVARYKGRIGAYQIWNEAQSPQFWKGTPTGLAHLTRLAAQRVAALDPSAVVVSTPLQPRQPSWRAWSAAYLSALAERGWPVDVFAVHSYQPDVLATPDGRFDLLRQVQSVLRAAGAPRRPLWDTEVNYSSPAFADHPVQGQQAADWTARTYLDSIRLGVARTYWYAWDDPLDVLGVTMTPGGPSQRAFTALQGWVAGSTFRGCASPPSPTGVVVTNCTFSRGDRRTSVVWASAGGRAPVPVGARSVCGLLTGCRPVDEHASITTSPVLLQP